MSTSQVKSNFLNCYKTILILNNTLMTASLHVVTKLLIVSTTSKVDYQNKVLPPIHIENNL